MDRAPFFLTKRRAPWYCAIMRQDDKPYKSIREFPAGLLWTRDEPTPEEAQRMSSKLQAMPVAGTGYLLNEDEGEFLLAVPKRHRN